MEEELLGLDDSKNNDNQASISSYYMRIQTTMITKHHYYKRL